MSARQLFVLAEENPPGSGATVGLVLHGSPLAAEAWLDARLKELRENPRETLQWLETAILRALSEVGREPGAEHTKETGRRAGAGRLTRGS